METLFKQFSLTLPLWVFAVAGLYLVIGTYGLWRMIGARLQLSNSNEPRQGFLNKPLLQFVAVVAMSAAVGGVVYLDSINRDAGVITQAEKQIEIEINSEIVSANQISSEVVLSAVPIVKGKEWGDSTQQFDIVWTVQQIGGTAQNFVEQGRSGTTPSNIKVTLQNGDYRITALISDDEQTYSETIEIEL